MLNYILQLENLKKTSVNDLESGAIRNPEIQILVSETEQINEYSGKTNLFSILKKHESNEIEEIVKVWTSDLFSYTHWIEERVPVWRYVEVGEFTFADVMAVLV